MVENFEYSVGDTIELTVDKQGYAYQTFGSYSDTWKKGDKLVISRVYSDGDVYATKDDVSRLIKKDEFVFHAPDLSGIVIGNVTIHSNMNGKLISKHYDRLKEEEKRKKEEEEKKREEYLEKYGTRYPTSAQLRNEGRDAYAYGSGGFCIKFFEWSNLESTPRTFCNTKYFFDFLDNNSIKYSNEDRKFLLNSTYAYCTCIRGKAELLISTTLTGLHTLLEKYSKQDNEEEKQSYSQWILCKETNRYTFLRTITYNESGDVSSFTFGDSRDEAHVFNSKDDAMKAGEDVKKKTAGFIDLIPIGIIDNSLYRQ